MDEPELQARIEEIELALSGISESPVPAISSDDEGTRLFIQVSWVIDSHRDSTLDARCVVTLEFTHAQQFERYAALDTARRKAFQACLGEWVREQFNERQTPPALRGDCAVEVDVPDELC